MRVWCVLMLGVCLLTVIAATSLESEQFEEDDNDREILVRSVRGTKERGKAASGGSGGGGAPSCRYTKGQWSECDAKNNTRTRTLTLRRGDKNCDNTKVVTKKCKKACRYEKGTWASCVNQQMVRIDTIKPKSDPTCEKSRRMTRGCKAENNVKKTTKDRSSKKAAKQ